MPYVVINLTGTWHIAINRIDRAWKRGDILDGEKIAVMSGCRSEEMILNGLSFG
jgi:hypothetical protein